MQQLYFFQHSKAMLVIALLLQVLCVCAQPASISYPFAVGRQSACGNTGNQDLHYYTYNNTTKIIANATGGSVGPCIPQLRIGNPANGTQRFTSNYASVSYNPADKNIYYFWTALPASNPALTPGGKPRTYVWRWSVGSCAGSNNNKLDTVRSFAADILGVAFGNNGNGYIIEFTDALPTVPVTYKPLLRSINFANGQMGAADTLALTGGAKVYQQGSGDVAITPSGQMFFVVDNKLFTPNYTAYTGTGANITSTFIDTLKTSGNFVGLAYADGQTIAAFSGTVAGVPCPFQDIDPLTAVNANITKSGTVWSASDMAAVVSGIGAAKKLVSVTPTGVANRYIVEYDLFVKNYGNFDLTNVQVADNLGSINGALNVSGVSVSFVSNPAGLVLNPLYNGTTNTNLLNGSGILPNFPVANNSVTIRVRCTLSNILQGNVYNNTATATARGFNNQNLSDLSTNGDLPDLDNNDKADDAGENQPTPLLISVAAQTPPCAKLSTTLFAENFGTGTTPAALGAGLTTFTFNSAQPLPVNAYMLTTNATNGDNARFVSLTDASGMTNGRLMVVNGDAEAREFFYTPSITAACAGQQYSVRFAAAFIGNSNYRTICDGFGGFRYPKVKVQVIDVATGLIITETSTPYITSNSWGTYGIKWVMPAGFSNFRVKLINEGQGGCGNDIAIDDLQVGLCDPIPVVTLATTSSGCIGSTTVLKASLSDPDVLPGTKAYQWQVSSDGTTWTNIGTNADTYTIAALGAADVNKQYRVIVAAQGNLATAACQYPSLTPLLLSAKVLSVAPTSISVSNTSNCPGDAVTLSVQGGTLGAGAQWRWYTGTCGATPVGTGPSITVSPTVATTYFVRGEGDCNVSACTAVTVGFNCDIDKDNDGMPDAVEGNGDADGDGVANFLDLDSDNDGIPDVVESGGVDANGDGVIDNYTDTDNDGLTQVLDASNTGHLGSGNGLGAVDTDGDGVPNFLDLDSDNDGIPDLVEVYGADTNSDGRMDNFADSDGDGFANSVDGDANNDLVAENSAAALLRTGADTNNDGRADSYPFKNMDADGRPNPYDLDSDGDGITDVREAGFADADGNGMADGPVNATGRNTSLVGMPLVVRNTDAAGLPDAFDIDSDNDGIPDNIEASATNAYVFPSGADSDKDGIDNSYDAVAGFGGGGQLILDTDGDGLPDYRDGDTDGDGLNDVVEGNDFNRNGKPDDLVTLTGQDTDNDGLDDRFDADNTSARGTSAYLGNYGSFTGPANPGSRTVLQRTLNWQTNRDWRSLAFILACTSVTIEAKTEGAMVYLSGKALCDLKVKRFVLERNVGSRFEAVAEQAPAGLLPTCIFADDPGSLGVAGVRYRIVAHDENGQRVYSSEIKVAGGVAPQRAAVLGTPVRESLHVSFGMASAGKASLQVCNATGAVVYAEQRVLAAGANHIVIDAGRWPQGVYYFTAATQSAPIVLRFVVVR